MIKPQLLRLLEDTLGMDENTLKGNETLRDLAEWDSMATLYFIATVDKHLGVPLSGDQVAKCQTVADLLVLMGNRPLAA